ncbi:MAG: AI-2E family transporter [Anaerolineales bacterium]|nr:AI-2E family transporter [Anaerolineales bacterium]
MQNYVNLTPPVRISLIAVGVIAVIFAMHAMAAILGPFLLAVLFSVLFWALLEWLKKRGLPSWAAIGIVALSLVLSALLIGSLLSATLNELESNLPTLEAQFPQQLAGAEAKIGLGGILPSPIISPAMNPANLLHYVLDGMSAFITSLFLIVFYVIFMVMEAETLRAKLHAAFSDHPSAVNYADGVTATIRRYIVVQTLLSVLVGFLVWISLVLIRVDFAVVWGVLAFLLNFVPNFGPILAAIPAVLTAFIQYGASIQLLLVIAAYTLIVIVVGSFIFPASWGRASDCRPLWCWFL